VISVKPNSKSDYVSAVSRVKCVEGFCTLLLKHLVLAIVGELVLSKPWEFCFTSKVSVTTKPQSHLLPKSLKPFTTLYG